MLLAPCSLLRTSTTNTTTSILAISKTIAMQCVCCCNNWGPGHEALEQCLSLYSSSCGVRSCDKCMYKNESRRYTDGLSHTLTRAYAKTSAHLLQLAICTAVAAMHGKITKRHMWHAAWASRWCGNSDFGTCVLSCGITEPASSTWPFSARHTCKKWRLDLLKIIPLIFAICSKRSKRSEISIQYSMSLFLSSANEMGEGK